MTRILDRARHERGVDDAHGGFGRDDAMGASDDGAEFEMYVIEAPAEPDDHPFADALDAWRHAFAAVQDHAREINSPGGFIAPPADFPTLTGFREDIQLPLHADPRAVTTVAVEGGLFARDVRGLRVDEASLRTHKTELAWDATLRTSPWRRRPAVLRISPSPSLHVTVVRLTPLKSQRIATRAFIRAGLRATFELAARLERAL